MTFEERKELADLEYDLQVAFYNYENKKQLNLSQKSMLDKTFKMLKKMLDDSWKELLASGRACEYFDKIYGVKL